MLPVWRKRYFDKLTFARFSIVGDVISWSVVVISRSQVAMQLIDGFNLRHTLQGGKGRRVGTLSWSIVDNRNARLDGPDQRRIVAV